MFNRDSGETLKRWIPILAMLMVPALAAGAALGPGGTFIDDDGSPHEGAIEAIFAASITTGCDPVGDRFCPAAPVTRGEMAVFLVRALGETTGAYQGLFSDVPSGPFYSASVERIANLGISNGVGNGQFNPNGLVTRAEMAAFLIRALNESESNSTDAFTDVPSDSWYAGYAARLLEMGITTGCATNPLRYCPLGAVSRAEMASFLARAFALQLIPPPPRPSVQNLTLALQPVATGLDSPMFVDTPAGDSRLFVIERAGKIKILQQGAVLAQPFLDITGLVGTAGEGGLLGMAFHPGYASNGRFFVSYTDKNGDSRVVEYAVSGDPALADATSARPLLFVDQPASNHNGGMIAFGPDGDLYVGLGDGGGGGDTFNHGQRPETLLATITAIDVDSGQTSLLAYGVRNPWRFAVDGDRFYIADVGQGAREEVDVISIYEAGANLGWSIMEGSLCFGSSNCNSAGLVLPVTEYTHSEGCSITGGYVYRGSAIPELTGHYFYGDFCSGFIRSFRYTGGIADAKNWPFSVGSLTSFGTDGFGELYVVSLGGTVSKVIRG